MSEAVGYGLDLGTSNSSIAIAYDDHVEVLEIYPDRVMSASLPSISYLHRNSQRAAGVAAVQQFLITGPQRTGCQRCELVHRDVGGAWSDCLQYRQGGGCLDSRLISGLKSELSNPNFTHTHSWAIDFELTDLVAITMRELKARADRVVGRTVNRVVVGHPVAFVGASGPHFERLQRLAEDHLVEAASTAGFDEIQLYSEPAAAVLGERLPDGYLVAVDFGGGTFDVAVIEAKDGEGHVTALHGAPVGGELFDGLIFDHKLAGPLGLRETYGAKALPVPAWFVGQIRTMAGIKHLMNNPLTHDVVQGMLSKGRSDGSAIVEGIIFGGHAYAFYREIEDAKIRLSRDTTTSIEFHRPGLDLSIPLTRTELDAMVAPYLDDVDAAIHLALEDSGVQPRDVTTVIRTGGSSLLALFIDRLEMMFGAEKIRERPVFTSVTHGLGLVAQQEWS